MGGGPGNHPSPALKGELQQKQAWVLWGWVQLRGRGPRRDRQARAKPAKLEGLGCPVSWLLRPGWDLQVALRLFSRPVREEVIVPIQWG